MASLTAVSLVVCNTIYFYSYSLICLSFVFTVTRLFNFLLYFVPYKVELSTPFSTQMSIFNFSTALIQSLFLHYKYFRNMQQVSLIIGYEHFFKVISSSEADID